MIKIALIGLLISNLVYADAYSGKEDIKPDGKPEIVYEHKHYGMLLPYKTYNEGWDGQARPKYWNGYGVDPVGRSYYHYWNEETKCYKGYREVWEEKCREEENKGEEKDIKDVPTPKPLLLIGFGLVLLWFWKVGTRV